MSQKKHLFTQLEKKCFRNILKTYSHIIEDKNSDSASLHQKNEAWNRVTREYNASPHVCTQVTPKQLRRLWMNLKQRQREALAKEQQYRIASGAAPPAADTDVPEPVPVVVKIEEVNESDTLIETASQMDEFSSPNTFVRPTTPASPLTINNLSTALHTASTINSVSRSTILSGLRHKNMILENEYIDRKKRADELHQIEMEIARERLREAKAKADMAELLLTDRL